MVRQKAGETQQLRASSMNRQGVRDWASVRPRGGWSAVAPSVQSASSMESHARSEAGDHNAINHQRLRWGFAVFAAIALFFLWEEHRAHLLGALPWLLLLACPLLHRFMHRGHDHSAGGGHPGGAASKPTDPRGATPGEQPGAHEHGGHGHGLRETDHEPRR